MGEPTTALDGRFSEPGSVATRWEDTLTTIETAQLSWISTVRADGRPHVTPLVTVWLDGALHFCAGSTEQKAVNLESNRAVVVTTGCAEWSRGLDVMVEGDAERVRDRTTLERLAALWAQRWDGRWHFEVVDDGFLNEVGRLAWVYAVSPLKVLAFGKGDGFTSTTHRFDDR